MRLGAHRATGHRESPPQLVPKDYGNEKQLIRSINLFGWGQGRVEGAGLRRSPGNLWPTLVQFGEKTTGNQLPAQTL